MNSTMTMTAPHIADVDTDSPAFQAALAKAGKIMAKSPLRDVVNVYSFHDHYPWTGDEVLFEEGVAPRELALYPMPTNEATKRGLPSCWRVMPDGKLAIRRYADHKTHKNSGFDVTDSSFLAELARIGKAFAEANLQNFLELNIARKLLPTKDSELAYEVTNEAMRHQRVTVGPRISLAGVGNKNVPACWKFTPEGKATVTASCINCP